MSSPSPPVVLVVDDDTAVRKALGAMLACEGYATRLVGSGAEAVAVYSRHRDELAAVVLDVRMPGMDGPQTLAELQAVNPTVPCVFVTGYAGPYAESDLEGRGAVVLNKPVSSADLGQAIRAVTDRVAGP